MLSRRLAFNSICCFLIALFAAQGAAAQQPSAELHLLDLEGKRIDPFESTDARATVFLFLRSDCPISNRYAPEVRRLHKKFAGSGIAFWLVYVDPAESVEAIRLHMADYQYRLGALRDPRHSLVMLTGATVTPEAAIFTPGRKLSYRGRIDNRYVEYGKARRSATTHDVERVLQAIIDGRAVKAKTTPAIGCFISDLR